MNDREAFDLVWTRLEKEGRCDGKGGAQYRRLLAAWHGWKREASMEAFIREDDKNSMPEASPATAGSSAATSSPASSSAATSSPASSSAATRSPASSKPPKM